MDEELKLDYKEGFNLGYALQKAGNKNQLDELVSINDSSPSVKLKNLFEGLEAGQRQAAIELSQDVVNITDQNYEEGKNVIGRANDSYTNRVILHGRSSPDMADELSERPYSRGIILKNDEKGEATSDYDEEKRQREFEEGVMRNNTRDDSKRG